MPVNDPIADLLATLKNCATARIEEVKVPASKMKNEICEILKAERYIEDYELVPNEHQGTLRVVLRYRDRQTCAFADMKRISKPGRRHYVNKNQMPRVLGGLGIAILSTPRGIVTDSKARELGVGGEVLCHVW